MGVLAMISMDGICDVEALKGRAGAARAYLRSSL
jgi:hypothetical protein